MSSVSAQTECEWLHTQIERLIKYEPHIDSRLVPGLTIGVYDGDRRCIRSFGGSDTSEMRYELGSATKPIVAWLTLKALDSLGYLSTEPICTLLPDTLCNEEMARLQIEHILTHRAGFSRFPAGIGRFESDVRDPYETYSISDLARDVREERPVPGMYSYSHVGYALLYWLFERVGGMQAFLDQQLVNPMHLTQMTFDTSASLAPGHGMDGRPQPPWHTASLSPAMGLRAGVDDLIRFMRFITPSLTKRIPFMTKKMKKEMHRWSREGMYQVEIGWFLIPSGKDLIYYHNGRTGGHHASIAFSPLRNKGVVVLSNGAAGSGELSISILHMLLRSSP